MKDDPAYGCIGASWTRIWLNPNVVVELRQNKGRDPHAVRVDGHHAHHPARRSARRDHQRNNVKGHPALGFSAAGTTATRW
jgi:hypothetical protein